MRKRQSQHLLLLRINKWVSCSVNWQVFWSQADRTVRTLAGRTAQSALWQGWPHSSHYGRADRTVRNMAGLRCNLTAKCNLSPTRVALFHEFHFLIYRMTIMRVAINCLQNDIYFCNKFALSFCSVNKLMLTYRTGVYNLQFISKTLSPATCLWCSCCW